MRKGKRRHKSPPRAVGLANLNDRVLSKILIRCDYKIERLARYMLETMDNPNVCNYCKDKKCGRLDGIAGLANCTAALTEYIKESEDNA